ncbi:MAG: hypothetical protein KKG75_00760 [Nanoarchaeota archaeon]|nr:hypothetical protein [Nanoarchaeota archaeon]
MLVLCLVVLILPNLLRNNPFSIGEESFYHLRIAKDILSDGFLQYDELSFSGRDTFLERGLSYSIASVSFITKISVETSAKILFLLLGLFAVYLLHLIFKLLNLKEGLFALPVLIISPAFIYLFTVINRYAVSFILLLLLVYFFLKKRYYLSGFFLLLMPLFSYAFTSFILISGLFYFLYKKKSKLLLIFLFLILLVWIFTLKGFNLEFISDLGGDLGLSIFGIFIVFVGLGFFWKKKRFISLYLLCLILFIFYLKLYWMIFILNIPFCLLIAYSFTNLLNIKWESELIKELTILLLICGLLLSGFSFVKSLSDAEPTEEIFDTLSLIPRGSVVLSIPKNGYWINYAGMKNVVDEFVWFTDFEERNNDIETLFWTENLNEVVSVLDKYNVDYILLGSVAKHKILAKDEEGILFFLKYSDKFKKLKEGNIELWRYVRE